jgi:hypothetical protein
MSGNQKNKKCFIVMAIVSVCFTFSPPQAGAGTSWTEKQKFLASDGAAADLFGRSVSISGDYAIVGAEGGDGAVPYSGAAYIFKWDRSGWIQLQKLTASDGVESDYFGYSVSIDGDYAIIGAYFDDEMEGSAYIFRRDGLSWTEQAKLTASDREVGDLFGVSVSIDGDYAIVGAENDNGRGSAYIFKRDGTSWTEQQKVLGDLEGDSYDWFGRSVSISGDYAIVGAEGHDTAANPWGQEIGTAYVFKRDGTIWGQKQQLLASDGMAYDCFGHSVAINGDYAIVGAYYSDDNGSNSGSAYIFKRDGTSWIEQQKITASDGAAGDYFGQAVSISGDFACVGANGDNSYSGSAYIFRRDVTIWGQQTKMVASDSAAGDYFGVSVSINGNEAIAGAMNNDDNGNNSGSAYLFYRFCPRADLNDDCKVDFADFAIFADDWLYGTN